MKRVIAAFIGLCIAATVVWADDTLNGGLTLVIPSQGARNWGTLFKNSFATPISNHDHTGGGKGLQISTNAIATNSVTGAKIRLNNSEYLRARNASNSANIDILRLSLSDELYINLPFTTSSLAFGNQSILANTSDGADNLQVKIGHADSTRGASATFYGNESAQPGIIQFQSGPGNTINFASGITTVVQLSGNGDWIPQADDGRDLGDSTHAWKNLHVKRRTHSPTLGANVALTSSSTQFWRYTRLGKVIHFNFTITIKPSSSAAFFTATLPAASASLGGTQGGVCYGAVGSLAVGFSIGAGTSTMNFIQLPSSTWASGVDWVIECNGSYEEA